MATEKEIKDIEEYLSKARAYLKTSKLEKDSLPQIPIVDSNHEGGVVGAWKPSGYALFDAPPEEGGKLFLAETNYA